MGGPWHVAVSERVNESMLYPGPDPEGCRIPSEQSREGEREERAVQPSKAEGGHRGARIWEEGPTSQITPRIPAIQAQEGRGPHTSPQYPGLGSAVRKGSSPLAAAFWPKTDFSSLLRIIALSLCPLLWGKGPYFTSGVGRWQRPHVSTCRPLCPQNDEEAMVEAVALYNPVSFAFEVTDDFLMYKKGVYSR